MSQVGEALKSSPSDFKLKYKYEKPSKDQEIIFHCKLGGRAQKAAEQAISLGYQKYDVASPKFILSNFFLVFSVKNYKGSWAEWSQKEGL